LPPVLFVHSLNNANLPGKNLLPQCEWAPAHSGLVRAAVCGIPLTQMANVRNAEKFGKTPNVPSARNGRCIAWHLDWSAISTEIEEVNKAIT
jgi:hypothetical protein